MPNPDYLPQKEDESDTDFLVRSLNEHRWSHQFWVDHYLSDCKCHDPVLLGGVEEQREAVQRYDEMIRITKALIENQKPTPRPVQIPRV